MQAIVELSKAYPIQVIGGLAILVCAAVAFVARAYLQRTDSHQAALNRMEAESKAKLEDRLTHFYRTGHLSPPRLTSAPNRGASSPRRDETVGPVSHTPYSDMAAKYGFEAYKHYERNELVLVDSELVQLDVKNRVVVLPLNSAIHWDKKVLRRRISHARQIINKRAHRAGIAVVKRRKGRPAKEGVSA